jgi:hypothetical protein
MSLICLSGWKASGKDMLAAYLIENYGAKRVALADPLKDMTAEEYDIDRASLDDPNTKESPLLGLPVSPKDGFTRMIAEFMVGEFRSESGIKPTGFEYQEKGSVFVGKFHHTNHLSYATARLYWTPRALAILKGSVNRSVTSDYWINRAFDQIKERLNDGQMVVVSDVRYRSELGQFKEQFGNDVVFVRVKRHDKSLSTDPSEMDLNDAKFDFYVDNSTTKLAAYNQIEVILGKIGY